LGSADVVKRRSKNYFMHHLTPPMMRPIRHTNTATVFKIGPTIVVGSAKAQGSKAKHVYGSQPPRETRVRDKATQRMTNILVHSVPHRGDPASSSSVFESRLGGFLNAPMWAGT
jgi:hypothetical protein